MVDKISIGICKLLSFKFNFVNVLDNFSNSGGKILILL
jgi:hypothetical protein